jgi:hypothetical protein
LTTLFALLHGFVITAAFTWLLGFSFCFWLYILLFSTICWFSLWLSRCLFWLSSFSSRACRILIPRLIAVTGILTTTAAVVIATTPIVVLALTSRATVLFRTLRLWLFSFFPVLSLRLS